MTVVSLALPDAKVPVPISALDAIYKVPALTLTLPAFPVLAGR